MNEKNTPNVDDLQAQLAELGITPKATVREMHKQVKKALKQKAVEKKQEKLLEFARIQNEMKDSRYNMILLSQRPQPFAYYLVLDFEGTCDENSRFDYASEIIEFPVILIDGQTLQIVDQFHRYVRPILQPTLTEFCISLTGITQVKYS
ncbi:3'-5' exoribonuclease 1 [Globomyces sp. JEL0801]|nr:3'-5' exoribonuclease 1 [Globomyces sp. JEL0801]